MSVEQQQIGPYRILRLLGYGSSSEVYLVEDIRYNRQDVLKLFRPSPSAAHVDIRLVEQEARTLMGFNHPAILPLLDFGETPVGEVLVPYTVTPLVPGGTLASWLPQNAATLTPQSVALMIRRLADALQYAHDRGIVHKDVKPSNIFLRGLDISGVPDIMIGDFAISQMVSGIVRPGGLENGNPTYMAPEQWTGRPTAATDQYALAVIAYQLLVGRPPFQGTPDQLRYEHASVAPTPPSELNYALSPQVDTVLLRALAKEPVNRFPAIAAFGAALEQVLVPPQPAMLPAGSNITNVSVSQPEPRRGPSTAAIVAITVLVLLLLGFAGLFIFQQTRNPSTANSNATATAQAEGANNSATATANAQNANGTVTAASNATATAQAEGKANANATAAAQHANATATAGANATATAGTNATATAVVAPAAQFSGNWSNIDTSTKGITRVAITNNGTTLNVHPYAKCGTSECDWGTQSGKYNGSPFLIDFNYNNQTHVLQLSMNSDGSQLKVIDTSVNQTYQFKKVE